MSSHASRGENQWLCRYRQSYICSPPGSRWWPGRDWAYAKIVTYKPLAGDFGGCLLHVPASSQEAFVMNGQTVLMSSYEDSISGWTVPFFRQ